MSHLYILKDQQRLDNCIAHLKTLKPGYMVRILKPGKTPAQRNYWHSLLDILADHQGESPEHLKDKLKLEWLPLREATTMNGKTYLLPKHTEDLNKEDYGLLIEKTLAIMSFLEIPIKSPSHFGLEK